MCTCRGCYLLFSDQHADVALPRRARPLPVLPRLRLRRRGLGRAQIPVSLAFCSATRSRSGWWPSTPSPAGATESELDAGRRGTASSPPTRGWASCSRRRGAAHLARATTGAGSSAACWCPSTSATSWSAPCADLAGFDGGEEARNAMEAFFAGPRRGPVRLPRSRADEAHDRPAVRGPRRHRRALRRRAAAQGPAAASASGPSRGIHAIALRCQVRIEPQRRPYDEAEQSGLRGLFGERERWTDTLRPFLWMQTNTMVQGFSGTTEVDLPLPCTYDFDVIGLALPARARRGRRPAGLMFSGTVFTRGARASGWSRCRGTARLTTACRSRCGDR